MKKKLFAAGIIFVSALTLLSTSCTKKSDRASGTKKTNIVTVYSYDSFVGEWGPGDELCKRFEEEYPAYKLNLVDCGDAIQAFNKAVIEKDDPAADVIVGIDNNLSSVAKKSGILEPYTPKAAGKIIDPQLQEELDSEGFLTPYDYSHFAMIFDTESGIEFPSSLEDLTKDIYRKKIILMDPRTSTPGLGFISWTVSKFGDGYEDFWKALKPNILTMTSGWSEGWGMFLENEAPLVISYTTSPAYNVEYEDNYRYAALIFDHGHVQQVEGFALVKNGPNPEGAKAFMDFMISEKAQETLPLTQWMYPANKNVKLPESYSKAAPVPATTLHTDSEKTSDVIQKIISILEN